MSDYRVVPVDLVERAANDLERFANDTLNGRNTASDLREAIAAAPAVHGEPVGWQLDSPGGRVFLEKEYPAWAGGGDGYRITPLYAAPQIPTAVQPGDECPRCNGKGRHATGPIDCPAMTICKLCSVPSAQPGPLTCMTGKVCGGDATLNTVNVELDAAPEWGDLPIGARVSLRAGGEEAAEQQRAPDVAAHLVEALLQQYDANPHLTVGRWIEHGPFAELFSSCRSQGSDV